ncbi:MAG TPA: hypothetical protein VHS56_07950 [Candidatus Cybelea sp.]|nr:hypothetical protein [Candidatus Cybelea sp.]
MIGSPARFSLIALLVLVQTGCGFQSSPAQGLNFAAPPDWKASPGVLGFMQFWRPPANNGEFLMLFRSPKKLTADDIFSSDRMKDTLQDATIVRRQPITICSKQPATYVEARGSSSKGRADRVELVLSDVGGASYIAMYVRPLDAPPNPMATASLRELCAKP